MTDAGSSLSVSETAARVLVVEDDPDVRAAAALLLRRHGLDVREADTPSAALQAVAAEPLDAVLLDLNFRRGATSGEEGLACLADLRAAAPSVAVVVVTAHSGVAMAVAAMRAGAVDFVTKPWSNSKLAAVMEAAALRGRAERRAAAAPGDDVYLGGSDAARHVRDLVRRAGPLDASVLVWGPAGSGKSLIARALHAASARADARLLEVDAAARGVGPALEALATADAGAVALHGVETLDAASRSALSAALAQADGRRVLTLSREPPASLRDTLGGELFYRLAALEIEAPPLARRGDDAVRLAEHWLLLTARRRGAAPRPLAPELRAALVGRAWLDDARGLRLAVERAALMGDGPLDAGELMGSDPVAPAAATSASASDLNLLRSERALVEAALKRWSFNVSLAARELGLTRPALYRRMVKHGL